MISYAGFIKSGMQHRQKGLPAEKRRMKLNLSFRSTFLSALVLLCMSGSVFNLYSAGIQSDAHSFPRDTSFTTAGTLKKEISMYPFIRIAAPALPENILVLENLVYSSFNGRELHLDLFCPARKAEQELNPAVVLVHAGGWRSGEKIQQHPMAIRLAENGYAAVAVEYRLSPEALFPAAVYDLKSCLRWLRAHAEPYHIDSNRVAILGCSSGGQLAALVGTTNGNPVYEGCGGNPGHSSDVQAIVDIDGLVDFTSVEALKYEDDPKKKLPSAVAWFGGRFTEKPAAWRAASPLYLLTDRSAPVLFINSGISRFHAGQGEMIARLKGMNIDSDVFTLHSVPHTFWLFDPWFEETMQISLQFLNKTLF
jgi:acetyl esterase/lipase